MASYDRLNFEKTEMEGLQIAPVSRVMENSPVMAKVSRENGSDDVSLSLSLSFSFSLSPSLSLSLSLSFYVSFSLGHNTTMSDDWWPDIPLVHEEDDTIFSTHL